MNTPKAWFLSGLVLMGLFATGHLAGCLQAMRAARHDPRLADLTRAMRAHKSPLLGFEPSILDFREYFSLSFSILLALSASLGLAAWRTSTDPEATMRALSAVYACAMLALLGVSLLFSIVQGVISCAAIAAVFAITWWRTGVV